jgi:GNAT superfamily N-acetyltransferase
MSSLTTNANSHQFTLSSQANGHHRATIENGLRAFNDATCEYFREARKPGHGAQPLDIYLNDDHGNIVGGLIACTIWGWLRIDKLWVAETLRGQGYGSHMLAMAEQAAVKRGCTRAELNTFSFQAHEFYQRHGYIIYGQLDGYPPGHSRYWLRKDLT